MEDTSKYGDGVNYPFCVCVCVRERERATVCRDGGRERVCVYVSIYMYVRKRKGVSLCVLCSVKVCLSERVWLCYIR